jgi:hypothetical protein
LQKVAAADPAAKDDKALDVIQHTLGEALFWLNHQIKEPSVSIAVDHRRGVINIAGTLHEASVQPIVGLTSAEAKVRISLTVAVLPDKSERAPNPAYIYTSVSGFGEYSLSSKKGPVKRFGHVIAGKDKTPDQVWTSRITVDLSLEARESRIHWPIGSLPKMLKTLDTKEDVELAKLAALVSARALRGALGPFDATTALKHVVTMSVTDQAIAMTALRVMEKDNKPRVAFATPWTFYALAEHRIIDPQEKGRKLAWTTLDHVSAIDAHILIDAAKTAVELPQPFKDGIFAFAARYRNILPSEGSKSPVIKSGIVLRAFAQAGFPVEALAIEFAKLPYPSEDGIIISAAGPTTVETKPTQEGPFWPDMPPDKAFISEDRHGVVLALPWLTALDENYQLGSVLTAFDQAPATGSAAWDAPDVDWAAGSPAPLARKPAAVQPIGAGRAAEMAALLARALQRGPDAEPVRALSAVEQLFLRPEKAGAKLKERPMWLRSLLALQTVWLATEDAKRAADDVTTIDDRVIMVVPSGEADGGVARFKLGPRRLPNANALTIGASGQLIAIDRQRTAFEPMPATEVIGAASGGGIADATRRARLASRADQLVKEPVAAIAVAARSTVADTDATIWIRIGIPPDFDDGALDIPVEIDAKFRLYASPALGWPTERGTSQAATGAIGMGEDRAFQDAGLENDPPAATPDDVRRYGSGLSGRAASLSLPARADTRRASRRSDQYRPVHRYPFAGLYRARAQDDLRSTQIGRPAGRVAARTPPLATEARAVVPVSQDLQGALSRVVKGQAAPIVPPHLERTTFGLRPGAMQAEFDSLLFTDGLARSEIAVNKQEDMSSGIGRFGRPGHAGPRLVRQLRPPRGPALPRVPLSPQDFVTSHGRRTFVELDDHATELNPDGTGEVKEQDTRFPTPFRLFEGVATVLRRHYKKKSGGLVDESYRIRLLNMPLPSEWDGSTLQLHVTSPSYPPKTAGFANALAQLGLLREPVKESPGHEEDAGLGVALSIDRIVVRFKEASWSQVDDAIILTFLAETVDRVDLHSRLDAVDGDTQIILNLRCARVDDNAAVPPPKFALASSPDQAKKKLEPEPRRQFALRVPVRPTARPSLNVSISTLVFADPSYDRELSGPGPSDSQRDKDGRLWKVALDRFEYGTDTPVYFGFGPIDAKAGLFGDTAPTEVRLTLQRQPAKNDDKGPAPPENLLIASVTDVAGE